MALFLNPLPVRRRKKAGKKVKKKARRKAKRKLTVWQRLVKKHKGNIKAAKKEYRRKSASGTSSTSRRSAAGSRKRRKPAGKRKAVPVAKRKRRTATRKRKATKSRARRKPAKRRRRRRAVIAPSATWRRAVRRKTGKRVKARTTRKRSLKRWKAGMRKGLKRKGTRKWRRAVLAGVSAVNPRRKRRRSRRRRRNPVARRRVYRRAPRRSVRRRRVSTRRYRNPVSVRAMKMVVGDLVKKGAVKDYLYITAGFVAGGILPGVVQRALFRAGILKSQPSVALDIGISLGTAVAAGAIAGLITKKKDVGLKVAGGAVAGILGRVILRQIEQRWPVLTVGSGVSGLGAIGSDSAVRRGIEAEIRRSAGVGGEFISEEGLERELAGPMGAFVTQDIADASADVSGMGADVDEDIRDGTDTFGGGGF